ncbi:hypothetical protein AALP_AA6G080600 [Arabis alpina]|uniref:F-box associated beta-propeller type 1 domain-containing protein n=1 Tax=Arabis alpina TaxID=50452 RepID=A0A087GMU3_ARAAL|nr:hypothetical protein AALP_AA6G080600 [Arabis alpina]
MISRSATRSSCDGLISIFSCYDPSYPINPPSFLINLATRWYQSFPLSSFQHLVIERFKKRDFAIPCPKLGLGRDKLKGTFKPVWLYNSSEFGLDNVTTCEVFDFSTNAWRYVLPASPYRIISFHKPVYLDGSLYWFTECEETKVLSFHLHTETFQVVSKTPFARVLGSQDVSMCILDDRLCVSEKNGSNQVIWSFDGNNKTWEILCSIDLTKTYAWLKDRGCALWPIALLDKTKLLLHGRLYTEPLIIHDLHTKSYDLSFKPTISGNFVNYCQSLFSALPN